MNYSSSVKPVFCPGCGDFGVHAALLRALTELNIDKSSVAIVSGIGCSSSMPHLFSTYGMHSLHGRPLPVATGMRLANSKLTVIVTTGDGDAYGIGSAHLLHVARRNVDITMIVMNNQIYGLTTGQASPTSLIGAKTVSTPFGDIEEPINPLAVALSAGATYVARGFSGDPMNAAELIKNGILHNGFALIDMLSPCVTFNTLNTYDWFRKRVYKLGADHDPSNFGKAIEKAMEPEATGWEKIPIGLFYQTKRPTYEELDVTTKNGPLIETPMPSSGDVEKALEIYK